MTNNEAIQELKHQVYKNTDNCEMKISKDCYKAITNALEENTKLKAEIEQLKAELEKSVKLPCKCENCVYADFMNGNSERFYCMEHHRYMVVGGYCSFGKSEVSE